MHDAADDFMVTMLTGPRPERVGRPGSWRRGALRAAVVTVFAVAGSCRRPAPIADGNTAAMTAVVVERGTGCPHCAVSISFAGTLGEPADSILLDRFALLTEFEDGRFIAAPTVTNGVAAAYDSVGAVATAVGRFGDGPGENGLIRGAYPWSGDRILLLGGGDRLGWLNGRTMTETTVRTAKPWLLSRAVTLPRDGLIVANAFDEPQPIVVLDSAGHDRNWIGPATIRTPRSPGNYYVLGQAREPHAFWAATFNFTPHIARWRVDGTLERSIDRIPPWFPEYGFDSWQKALEAGDLAVRPFPELRGLRESSDGVLWSIYDVPALDWHADRPNTGRRTDLFHVQAYDGIIQLLDGGTGDLLVSVRTSRPLRGLLDDSTAYEMRETESGYWFINLYRVRFIRG